MDSNVGDFGYCRTKLGVLILFEFLSTKENRTALLLFHQILDEAKFATHVDGCGSFTYEGEEVFCLHAFLKHTQCDCAEMMNKFSHFKNYVDNAGFTYAPNPIQYQAKELVDEFQRLYVTPIPILL